LSETGPIVRAGVRAQYRDIIAAETDLTAEIHNAAIPTGEAVVLHPDQDKVITGPIPQDVLHIQDPVVRLPEGVQATEVQPGPIVHEALGAEVRVTEVQAGAPQEVRVTEVRAVRRGVQVVPSDLQVVQAGAQVVPSDHQAEVLDHPVVDDLVEDDPVEEEADNNSIIRL